MTKASDSNMLNEDTDTDLQSDAPQAASQPAAPKKPKRKIEDYEVEGAMSDLMRAEKHKSDPELMSKVGALAGRHQKALKAIKSVQDLKDRYQEKFGVKK